MCAVMTGQEWHHDLGKTLARHGVPEIRRVTLNRRQVVQAQRVLRDAPIELTPPPRHCYLLPDESASSGCPSGRARAARREISYHSSYPRS